MRINCDCDYKLLLFKSILLKITWQQKINKENNKRKWENKKTEKRILSMRTGQWSSMSQYQQHPNLHTNCIAITPYLTNDFSQILPTLETTQIERKIEREREREKLIPNLYSTFIHYE